MTIDKRASLLAVTLLATFLAAPAARAQSLTSGSVAGIVRDDTGMPVYEASVVLIDEVTGVRIVRTTPRNGTFRFTLLGPTEYHLLVERFGYRPRLYLRVPVQAGSELQADVSLARDAGATTVDSVLFGGAPARGMMLSLEHGATRDFASLADPAGLLLGVAGLLPGTDGSGGSAGLPGRLGALGFDGFLHRMPRHPRLADPLFDALAFPAPVVRNIEMLSRGLDVEWTGIGGGLLAGTTRPGTRAGSAMLHVAGGADLQTGSLVVGGPIVRDTAHYALGFNFARLRPRFDGPWAADSQGAKLASIAQDSFTTSLSSQLAEVTGAVDAISGFGRFDWAIAERHRIGLRASAGRASAGALFLSPAEALVPGAEATARHIAVAASLSSALSGRVGNELRVSVDAGAREYTGLALPRTVFADRGLAAGTSDLTPGTFKRTTIRFAETFHFRIRPGVIKTGVEVATSSNEHTFRENRAGTFYFGDTTGFASGNGVFTQSVGATPIASFRTNDLGLFAQALLTVTPALELRTGLRYDVHGVPMADVPFNTEWSNLTGLDNAAARTTYGSLGPRFGFTWTPSANRRWSVDGEAAISSEELDPGVLAEAITRAGSASMRRAVGAIGTWPTVPDSTIAPVRGRLLTVLGPAFNLPRTGRVGLGITGAVGGTLLLIQGLYRHTDFLPLRRDLNLVNGAFTRDQYGRPLHGTLTRQGELLAAVPGTNRRFSAFDAVSAIDPAAASDYYGLTLDIRRNLGRRFDLIISYTFSRTTDNWFGARDGSTEGTLVPFADSIGGGSWVQGTSDFDVPHRLTAGAQVNLGGAMSPRIGVLYRYHSGYPFTPGFRDGVDANGDGSARNDPAFVTDTVLDASEVIAGNSCLGAQVGRLAERNSCRAAAVSSLDVTLALTVWSRGGRSAELVADVIGALRSGFDQTDRALYRVNPAAPMTTTPGGVTSVPLVANRNFGGVLSSRDPGALWRIGLRIGL